MSRLILIISEYYKQINTNLFTIILMMNNQLTVIMITRNAEQTIEKSLESIKGLTKNILVIDDYSTDKTAEIAEIYQSRILFHHEMDLGKQKKYALEQARSEWVLVLDSDEILTSEVRIEIGETINKEQSNAFYIQFQTHFLGRPLHYGGENYKKLVLFKKSAVDIKPALVHEEFIVNNHKIGQLKHKILHYSYRSIPQMYIKFTDYALREAKQKKLRGEYTNLKKITLYPIHMFWARFIKDKGYKDGLFRIPLDLGFAYMEWLTYVSLLIL